MVKANPGKPANQGSSKFKKSGPSGSKANALGYMKRQLQKAKSVHELHASNVYEYAPDISRRSKVKLDLDYFEAAEYRIGMKGGNDTDGDALQAMLISENREDERIKSEDNEEIDSDVAFEESDEDRFAGFFSSKAKKESSKKGAEGIRFADVDLNEDEDMRLGTEAEESIVKGDDEDDTDEEDKEEGDDDFIDLVDVIDGKEELYTAGDEENRFKPSIANVSNIKHHEDNSGEGGVQDDKEEEGENIPGLSEESHDTDKNIEYALSDTDDAPPEALAGLQNFILTLDSTSKKRKAEISDQPSNPGSRKQRRLAVPERTEAGLENEFRTRPYESKLNLEDLLAPLASQSSTLLSFKSSIKALAPSTSSKIKTLAIPLPQRTQERLDREAAYEQTKEQVDKWSETMRRIREAEHLSFPLQVRPTGRVSNLEFAAKFKPYTALESSVDGLLKSARMRDEDLRQSEGDMLQMNKLTVEEVVQRRAELRKMRELMFRAEVKARRVGKIKSRMYRKVKRKKQERIEERLDEGEEGRLKGQVERARERAILRHKNTGRWARQMKGKEGMGETGRREVHEMLERGERLMRKIRGMGSDKSESEGEDDDGGDDGDLEATIEKIKKDAFNELKRVEKEDESTSIDQGVMEKSIFTMKFMKDAMVRGQQGVDKMVDDFAQEMGGPRGDAEGSETEVIGAQEADPVSGVIAQRAGGRVLYCPGVQVSRPMTIRPMGSLASDTSSTTLKSSDLLSRHPSPEQLKLLSVPPAMVAEANPWLTSQGSDSGMKAPRKKCEVVVGKDSTAMTRTKNKLKKQARKKEEEKRKEEADAMVDISMNHVLTSDNAAAASSQLTSKPVAQDGHVAGDDSEFNSEVEEQEKALDLKRKRRKNGIQAFEQRDLVALAFAGDNVVQEFTDHKRREISADAPRGVDTTIPGWGSWGGVGMRRALPKLERIKKIAGVDPKTRADFNKPHVIISEKRDKKAAKYLIKDLPYPYTSKSQFERSTEQPLGTEWNTRVAFQRGTLPKVVKKPGTIIRPLEKLN